MTAGYGAPAPVRTPRPVLAAVAMLGTGAAVTLLLGLAAVPAAGGLSGEIMGDPYVSGLDSPPDGELRLKIVGALACYVVVHAALAVVAVLAVRAVLRGSRTGHWFAVGTSFVLAGVALIGYAYGWLPHLLDLAAETADHTVDLDWINAHLPGWYAPYTVVGNLVSLALCTLAGLLLVLPSSVDHAARPAPSRGGGSGFEVPR